MKSFLDLNAKYTKEVCCLKCKILYEPVATAMAAHKTIINFLGSDASIDSQIVAK